MIDLIIIILVVLGALVGLKRGFTKELVSTLGFVFCVILAYMLKNPVALFLYDKLPFFSFGGVLKGVTALNILLYEVIAFMITFALLNIVLIIVRMATGIFEKFLTATIILGIPSKILGAILGALEWLVISFIALYVASLPVFDNNFVFESKIYSAMEKFSSRFNGEISNTFKVFEEFAELKEQYKNSDNTNQFNLDSLDLFLKYNVIDVNNAEKLYNKGKFKTISNIESVLDKYRKEN